MQLNRTAVMANGNNSLARNAITMVMLMLMSVVIGMVAAEIPDGDNAISGTTGHGIDRNPTQSEQDGADITRTMDAATVTSKDKITIQNGKIMTVAGTSATGSNTYSSTSTEWRPVGSGPDEIPATLSGMEFLSSGGAEIPAPCIAVAVAAAATTVTCDTAIPGGAESLLVAGVQVFDDGVLIGTISSTASTTTVITLAAANPAAVVVGSSITFHEAPLRMSNLGVLATSKVASSYVGGVDIVVTDASDGASGQSVTMTLQNWYGDISRTTAHGVGGVGGRINGPTLSGCTGPTTGTMQKCSLNGNDNGIDAAIATNLLMLPNEGSNVFSYAIESDLESATKYFGIDYTTTYNMELFINGVKQTVGNTKSVSLMDDVILRCSTALCTEADIQIGIPAAYKTSGLAYGGGTGATLIDENYNVTSSVVSFSANTVKLTFGTAVLVNSVPTGISNITATHGVFYDPSIRFLSDEPSLRVGQIENGGASWCDSWWFLAKCGETLSLDGLATAGVDGVILHYKVPLESMYSQASWGGYDKVQMVLNHNFAKQCFNGNIDSYVVAPKDIGTFQVKNSFLKYATSGDYYTMTEPTSQFASGTTSFGTATADYCFGSTMPAGQQSTLIDIGRIGQMTSSSPYAEYLDGFYDLDTQMYEFYVILTVEASTTNTPAASGSTEEFAFATGGVQDVATAMDGSPQITLENTVARNPLATTSDGSIRTTSTVNQTNPAFGSPYVMYYSGVTPSDNVIAGRNVTDQSEVNGDWGLKYLGTQTLIPDQHVRKDFGVGFTLSNGESVLSKAQLGYANNNDATIFNSTPMSTIECGAAAFGGSMTSAGIEIFTSLDTSQYYGAGQNDPALTQGFPSAYGIEETWKAYGTLDTNSSRWASAKPAGNMTVAPNASTTHTGMTWAVDNNEVNTDGSNVVSFTGSFINGDAYKAVCTFTYNSDDIEQSDVTATTITQTYYFTALHDGNYVGSAGGDVSEDDDDDSWMDQLDSYDYIIIGLALTLIGLAVYMWSTGSGISSWFDDRVAMGLLGVAILHAWVAAFFGTDGTGDLTSDTALAVGTLGYLVMALAAYLWGNGTTSQGERNFRFALGGVFLIAVGVPAALTGLLNVESELLQDAMWSFPVYDAVAGLGSFIGIILLGSAAAGLYRRDGM